MDGKVLRTDGKVIQEFTVHPRTIHGWKSAQDRWKSYPGVHCTSTDYPWMEKCSGQMEKLSRSSLYIHGLSMDGKVLRIVIHYTSMDCMSMDKKKLLYKSSLYMHRHSLDVIMVL